MPSYEEDIYIYFFFWGGGMIFLAVSSQLEKVTSPTFSSFNPPPSMPSVASDDKKLFQCLNKV